jgi:hypothetical protein
MGALSGLPPELVVGWALWVIGGLLLTMWFVRRSAATRTREVAPPMPPAAAPRLLGADAVAAQPLSGTDAAAGRPLAGIRPAAAKSPAAASPPDAFDELRARRDRPDEPPRT